MRILIVEDSVLLREGISRLLADAGHEVVAALPDATQVEVTVIETKPELAILDVRLPPSFTDEGVRAALRLRATHPDLAVLVLSQYVEERYATDLIATNTGGLGYLLKDRVADVEEFLESVTTVGSGGTVLDPEVVAQLLTRRGRDSRLSRLTERESDVLALMAQGHSNHTIA
ncbi:MAG: response regulator transcription factor, partial [Ruaniaceae bacterium]|nr:response regulator transcription factor [Ruaniaceae bacterium]